MTRNSSLRHNMRLWGKKMSDIVNTLQPLPRFAVGIIAASFISYYALLIPYVALDIWNNILTNFAGIALNCSILLVLNGVGYAVRNPLKVGKCCGVLFFVLVLLEDLRRGAAFSSIAADCTFVGACPVINGLLFESYLKSCGPIPRPRTIQTMDHTAH